MNLDEHQQHIAFSRKKYYDEGPLFTPFEPTDDDSYYFRLGNSREEF